jgi:hypothetical protein
MRFQIGDNIIYRNKVREITNIGWDYQGMYYGFDATGYSVKPKPIPLTEDLFKEMKWLVHINAGSLNIKPSTRICYTKREKYYTIDIFIEGKLVATHYNIEYLHQLQQLYRLTTHKELKIKL